MVDLYTLLPTDDYLPEKGVSTKAEFHIQNTEWGIPELTNQFYWYNVLSQDSPVTCIQFWSAVVECQTPEQEVGSAKPTSAILCP